MSIRLPWQPELSLHHQMVFFYFKGRVGTFLASKDLVEVPAEPGQAKREAVIVAYGANLGPPGLR